MRRDRPTQTTLWIALACLVGAALVVALAACGGGSPATAQTATKSAPADGQGSVQNRADLARQRPRPVPPSSRCRTQVGGFIDALDAMRRNLAVGLSYEQYVGEVKTIRAAYDAIPTDSIALGCLKDAGTPGERGLNKYIAAGNTWTECVETPGCESATIEAELQQRWREASRDLSKAQLGLRRLDNG